MTIAYISSTNESDDSHSSAAGSDSTNSQVVQGQGQAPGQNHNQARIWSDNYESSDSEMPDPADESDYESDMESDYSSVESEISLGETDTVVEASDIGSLSDFNDFNIQHFLPHRPELLLTKEKIIEGVSNAFLFLFRTGDLDNVVLYANRIEENIWARRLCCWTCQRQTEGLISMTRYFMSRHVDRAVEEAIEKHSDNYFRQYLYIVEELCRVGSYGDLDRVCECICELRHRHRP